ncbi:TonB family protein [Candidatus Desantisbacteria bacterium]|nr:TonB family protein [Candidatus Desantisbacteria bacterium]
MFLFERQVSISFIISITVHICLLGFAYSTHVQSCQQTVIITDVELLEPMPLEEEMPTVEEKARVMPFWKAPVQATVNLLKKIKLIPLEPEKEAEKALDIEKAPRIHAPLIKEEEKPIEKPIEIKDEFKKKALTKLYEENGEKLPNIIELPKKNISLERKPVQSLIVTPEKSIQLEEVGEKQVEIKRVIRPGRPVSENFRQIPEETIHPEQLLEKKERAPGKRVIPLSSTQQERSMVNLQEKQEAKPIGIVEKKRVVVVPLQKTFMPPEDEPEKKASIAIEKKPVKKPAAPKPIVKPEIEEIAEEPKEVQPIEDKLKTLKKEGASTVSIIGPLSKRPKIRSPRPEYPDWAEKKGIESQVVIYFTVTPDGMVNSDAFVEQTSGYAQLDQLALQALKGWRFAPLPMDAEQKDQWGRVTFRFVLQ